MTLQETLDRIREAAKSRIPAESRAVMERSTEELRASGILDRVARVGQPAPEFTLPNTRGALYLGFGIDLAKGNGDGTWRLPIPARFVIDRQGLIRSVDADPDYTRRPEPARTLETLRRLAS